MRYVLLSSDRAAGHPPALRTMEANLPSLPLPELEHTCARYLASVRPLLTGSEFARTVAAVRSFQDPATGVGETLQARLRTHATEQSAESTSWLEHYWNEFAYFSNRVSVCFNVNYYFGFRSFCAATDPLTKAAWLVFAAFKFREKIIE